ncbi:MAG: OmpA family protein [Myxococcota bacterium]
MRSSDRGSVGIRLLLSCLVAGLALVAHAAPAAADDDDTNLEVEPELKEGEKPTIGWLPGWSVGLRGAWLFTSLEEVNDPVLTLPENDIEPIDAAGLLQFELYGGPYISKKFLVNGVGGGMFSTGTDTSFSMWYFGIEPSIVFPEHRFEFLLGVKTVLGGWSYNGSSPTGDKGYEGLGLVIEPRLTFRYIFTQEVAMDVGLGFSQFLLLTDEATGGAIPPDDLSQAGDNPLDWAAPTLSLGVVYGRMPPRKAPRLSAGGDKDKDGVVNKDDGCPRDPEDKDGFEDEDGCPDNDNDQDGVEDAVDKCPDDAEDKDGIMDEDGCPETDADQDGILDEADTTCPEQAEDKDGFQDDDGCPDTDNDGDGVLDVNDPCPDHPEDKDGFQDEDGCPDIDDDGDFVIDTGDACKDAAETWNGVKDNDGCPDRDEAKIALEGDLIVFDEPFPFGRGGQLSNDAKAELDKLVVLLKNAKHLEKLIVQVHTDDKGDEGRNKEVSVERANAIRQYLVDQGIDQSRMAAGGYGESKPIVDPTDLKGKELDEARRKNKRLEVKVIKTSKPLTFDPATAPKPTDPPPKRKTIEPQK